MGEKTNISWCTSTWSPFIGCTRVSPGCDHCYAEVLDKRHRYGGAAHWGPGVPRYRTKSWGQPVAWNKKAALTGERWTVFPSLCDPFDNEIPDKWRNELLDLIRATPNLTWLLLTKRIGNAARMMPFLIDNIWLGSSVVNQAEADRDIPKLIATPAAKRFVSLEPMLGPIDLLAVPVGSIPGYAGLRLADMLHWVICGGESAQGGAKARPFDVDWARQTVAQCKAAGVPVFVKQLGSTVICDGKTAKQFPADRLTHDDGEGLQYFVKLKDRAGADPAEWPEDLRIQETPT